VIHPCGSARQRDATEAVRAGPTARGPLSWAPKIDAMGDEFAYSAETALAENV